MVGTVKITLRFVLWAALLAVDAPAQRLLETDGVELLGEAQLVMSGGGTCNVLESDTAYEAKKENHGAPMDIWRLDFSVRNGSGRWLDHLIARFQIDSEWPDCTNWDGPDATEFAEFIEWADSIGQIQESGRNVVAPGQTLTETKFFIVLHGDPEPRFANWSMDFDFAAGLPTAAPAPGSPGSPVPAAPATAEQETVFWQSIMDSTNPAEFEAYLAQFPNGVFRALAEARLAALRAPEGDSPTLVGRPAGGVGSPAAGVTAGSDAPLRPGEVFRDCDGCPEVVVIPAGEFRMGSTSGDNDEQPVHAVRISRPFALSKYEVTQGQWEAVMGSNPSHFAECGPSCPVERVSWYDAQEFIGRLNARAGGVRFRLPTEAEWEYAARAGTSGDYYGNLDAIAWYDGNSGGRTHPVGQKAPNSWGLHDMHGNVYEWVEDCWHDSYVGAPADGSAWTAGGDCSDRVLRGGSWFDLSWYLRAANRDRNLTGVRNSSLGFRVARTLD